MQCLPIFVPHEKMYNMLSKTSNAMQLFFLTLLEFLKDVLFLSKFIQGHLSVITSIHF